MRRVLFAEDRAFQHLDGVFRHFAQGKAERPLRPFAVNCRAVLLLIQKRRASLGERPIGKEIVFFGMRPDVFLKPGKRADEKKRIPVHCRTQIVEIGRIAVRIGGIGERVAAEPLFCGGDERRVVDERLKKERVVHDHPDGDDGNKAALFEGVKFLLRQIDAEDAFGHLLGASFFARGKKENAVPRLAKGILERMEEGKIVRVLKSAAALGHADADQPALFARKLPCDGRWRILAQIADLQHLSSRLFADLDVRPPVDDVGDRRRRDARLARDIVDGDPLCRAPAPGALPVAELAADRKHLFARRFGDLDVRSAAQHIGDRRRRHPRRPCDLCDRHVFLPFFAFHTAIVPETGAKVNGVS